MRAISILGSTGSIGRSALDLIQRLNAACPGQPMRVEALAAHRSGDKLLDQVRAFKPALACLASPEAASRLREAIMAEGLPTRVVSGPEGLLEAATIASADFVLAAIVGAAGLEPTYAAVRAGKAVGLANKEALVLAGPLMMAAARESGSILLPVDSEHNALHQCLRGEKVKEVRRLILTASGGPFWGRRDLDLSRITAEEALRHPTWVMGPKITIDSATLMNKALEVIEAHWLFGVPADSIGVIIHPQSIVHSMVEFQDGSFVGQLGATDMRHPIQYALTWPDRAASPLAPLDLASLPPLTFETPDMARFPCLGFGWEALRAGGTMPAVLNAANEVAVAAFLDGKARFTDIARIIRGVMDAHRPVQATALNVILEADAWARAAAAGSVEPGSSLLRSRGTT